MDKGTLKIIFILTIIAVISNRILYYFKEYKILPDLKTEGYNIVVIITDDQRWDTLWAMPVMKQKLAGVEFKNAFVTTSLCCQMKTSFLSGGFYSHNIGTSRLNEKKTLAVLLQNAGYQTGFIGNYTGYTPGYVPMGWNFFIANQDAPDDWANAKMVTVGNSTTSSSKGEIISETRKYITYAQRDFALAFLDRIRGQFFLVLSTNSPHSPTIPAPEDADLFSEYPPVYQKQLRAIQSIDRSIGAIVERIVEKGLLEKTVFIFTSDNGIMTGEHGLDKDFPYNSPYEESIRVPFFISFPGITPRTDENLVAVNLDIAATILDIVDIAQPTDGISLLPLLNNPAAPFRNELLIENYTNNETYLAGLRVREKEKKKWREWKYVERHENITDCGRIIPAGDCMPTVVTELYDLTTDPLEQKNLSRNRIYKSRMASLSKRLNKLKGLTITTINLASGTAGKPYKFQMKASGAEKPYVWKLEKGIGLSLNPETGLLSGTPAQGELKIRISVTAPSSISKYNNKPQRYVADYSIKF